MRCSAKERRYLRNRKKLEERERGRWRGPAWYQYSRNQALDVVSKPKILTADLADRMSFSLDSDGKYYLLGGAAGGYGLLAANDSLVAPLLALLNSTLLEWMLRPPALSSPFRGGWFSCEARFINLLPIRLPTKSTELSALGGLAERAVNAYQKLHSSRSDRDKNQTARQIEAIESQINDQVFRLYGVNNDERRAVEESVREARRATAAESVDTEDGNATTDREARG